MGKLRKRELRRAVWASVARVVSVSLSAGGGSFLYNLIGTKLYAWPLAVSLVIGSFFLLTFIEYEREIE